jgi:hypothetical protein
MLPNPLATLLALAPAAYAAPSAAGADEAERDRIVEEMQALAARQKWKGVEQLYARLLELEKRGVVLAADQHMIGVDAARTFGNIDAVVHRLGKAIQAGDGTAAAQRADVLSRYGRVRLELAAKPPGEWALTQVPAPFAPDARAAIERADAALHDKRRFVGFLPAGSYQLGEARFQVDAGTSESLVTIAGDGQATKSGGAAGPKEAGAKPADTEAVTGLHARAGVGFGGATAPTEGQLAPPSGAGLTPVLGAGLAWRKGKMQISGLLVGRALFGTAGDGGQQLYMGTAELLLGWDLGPVRLEAGPLYGVGAGSSTGVATSADPTACAGGACDAEVVSGTTLGAGGELGLAIPLFEAGKGSGGLDLHAGAIGDGSRVVPWVTLALGISPGGRP